MAAQARRGAGPPEPGDRAGGADGLHLVDLSQASDPGLGLDPDASTKALTAAAAAQPRGPAERAAVGSLQAVGGPCEPVLEQGPGLAVAEEGMQVLVGSSEPRVAGARAWEGLAGVRSARGAPDLAAPGFPGGEGAGVAGLPAEALGDDSGPWAPFNESDLVPEVPPAIMWLIQEAEARPAPIRCQFLLRHLCLLRCRLVCV